MKSRFFPGVVSALLIMIVISPVMALTTDGLTKQYPSMTDTVNQYIENQSFEGSISPFNPDFYRYIEERTIGSLQHPSLTDTVDQYIENQSFEGSISPFNPDFYRYIGEQTKGSLDFKVMTHSLGYIPPSVDLSHLWGTSAISSASSVQVTSPASLSGQYTYSSSPDSLPAAFDLRSQGRLTAIKNQGNCGSCWAFSSLASLESTQLPGMTWDLSENNMRNTHGYDIASCQGGNSLMATAYLTRWSGPLTETSDPYSTVSRSAIGTTIPNPSTVVHVSEALLIPGRSGANDNTNLKKALVDYGAIYSTIRWEDSCYNSNTASFYYSGSGVANHAITIVGWDDSFDRTRFQKTPPANGAFIAKNSWGSSWGDGGYFYISYYDSCIGKDNAVILGETTNDYYHIYQYDPLGWVTSYGAGGETAYGANIFTAQDGEAVAAVSFYTPAVNTRYQVSVYRNTQNGPISGSPLGTTSGTIAMPGYHTVTLSEAVPVAKGEKFSVVLKVTSPGYQYPVAVEYPYSGYSSQATARSGESFVSASGSSWTDLSTAYANTNVCLKALTVKTGAVPTGTSTVTPTATPTKTPTPTSTPTSSTTRDITAPKVVITAPKTYGSVIPGKELAITWSSTDAGGVAKVTIEYSTDRGKTWIQVADNLPAAGSQTWTVPKITSSSIILKVSANDRAGNVGVARVTCLISQSKTRIPIPAITPPTPARTLSYPEPGSSIAGYIPEITPTTSSRTLSYPEPGSSIADFIPAITSPTPARTLSYPEPGSSIADFIPVKSHS